MRRGITLYEVVLALAIFAGSVAAISQAVATGSRAALQARLQSQAILLCQTRVGEIIAGLVPPTSSTDTRFPDPALDGWTCSVVVKPGPRLGVFAVEVTSAYRPAGGSVDASFTLTRLVRDQAAFINSATQAAASETAQKAAANQQQTIPQQN